MSLFVGNVSRQASEADLYAIFSKFGPCKIDLKTSFAFVEYRDELEAAAAQRHVHGTRIAGLCVNVEWSKKCYKMAAAVVANSPSRSSSLAPSPERSSEDSTAASTPLGNSNWHHVRSSLPSDSTESSSVPSSSGGGPLPSRTALRLMLGGGDLYTRPCVNTPPSSRWPTYNNPDSSSSATARGLVTRRPVVVNNQPGGANNGTGNSNAAPRYIPDPMYDYMGSGPAAAAPGCWPPPRRHTRNSNRSTAAALPYHHVLHYDPSDGAYFDDYHRPPPIYGPIGTAGTNNRVKPSATLLSLMMGGDPRAGTRRVAAGNADMYYSHPPFRYDPANERNHVSSEENENREGAAPTTQQQQPSAAAAGAAQAQPQQQQSQQTPSPQQKEE